MKELTGKKIVIFAFKGPESNGITGGIEVYEKEFAMVLEKMGAIVEIYCGRDKGEEALPIIERLSDNITVRRFYSLFNFLPLSLFPMHWYHIKKGRKDTDYVIENQSVIPMMVPLLYKNTLFTIIHHLTGKDYIRKQGIIKGSIGYIIECFVLPVIYKKKPILTVSNHTKKDIINYGFFENNITVIPPVVKTSGDSYPYKDDRENIISYVGRYTGSGGNKRIDHVIQILPDIIKEIPNIKLVVAGSMKKENELRDLVSRLSLEKHVEFKGFISEIEKAEILASSKAFVSPSYQEGFGITYIEANSYGTPVIGYEIPGLDTVPKDCGVMVKKDDKKSLKEAILNMLLNGDKWEAMSKKSLENAKKYSYEKVSKNINNYILSNIGEKNDRESLE